MIHRLLPVLGFVTIALTGCGPAVTDVTGRVTYKGNPVVFGTVMLIDADGVPKYGNIATDGTFTVPGVLLGSVKIAVSSPTPPGSTPARPYVKSEDALDGLDGRKPADTNITVDPAITKGWVPLPDKYADPTTSDLTAEITAGQPMVLDLK